VKGTIPCAEAVAKGRTRGRSFRRIADDTLRRYDPKVVSYEKLELEGHSWPGNVRELQHVVERAVITSVAGKISFQMGVQATDKPKARVVEETAEAILTQQELLERERGNLRRALEKTGWKVSGPGGAADLLGVNASTLASRIRTFRLEKPRS
jgi:formate hydrogenlyase transcriptional activator